MQISVQNTLNLINIIIESLFPDLSAHLQRTAYISLCLAQTLRLPQRDIEHLFIAASIHDIGILDKKRTCITASDLVDEGVMAGHEHKGVMMIKGIRFLAPVLPLVGRHHIVWNETQHDDLSLGCHILHMADTLDLFLRAQPGDYIVNSQMIIENYLAKHSPFPPALIAALRTLQQQDIFWFRLASKRLHRVLAEVSPLNHRMINTDDLLEVCQLIAKIIDTYSNFTMTHSISVSNVARFLAKKMALPSEIQKEIAIAGYLHDIGKLHVPLELLEKNGRLSCSEYALVRTHSYKTLEMLSLIKPLSRIKLWAANHHERLDGSGYPRGLTSYNIDLPSKILAIADVFTAMTENRPYRKGMEPERALDIIREDVQNKRLERTVFDVLETHLQHSCSLVLKM